MSVCVEREKVGITSHERDIKQVRKRVKKMANSGEENRIVLYM